MYLWCVLARATPAELPDRSPLSLLSSGRFPGLGTLVCVQRSAMFGPGATMKSADGRVAGFPMTRSPNPAGAQFLRPPPGLEHLAPMQLLPTEISQEDLQARWKASKSRAEVTEMLLKLLAGGKVSAPCSDGLSGQSTAASRRGSEVDIRSDVASSGGEGGDGATTLMIRNIPSDCTCDALLQEWPMDGSYDLLYLPRRAGGRGTLGYAFVNFTSPAHAEAFASKWRARRLSQFPKSRGLNITVADKQGFETNAQQLKQKKPHEMQSRQCEVVVVKGGRRVSLHEV